MGPNKLFAMVISKIQVVDIKKYLNNSLVISDLNFTEKLLKRKAFVEMRIIKDYLIDVGCL